MYTESELRQIQRHFGHTSITSSQKLFKRAQSGQIDSGTKVEVDNILYWFLLWYHLYSK